MLYLIGLGLSNETDVSVRGLELIKKAERVYLEAYTSILLVETTKLVSYSSYCHFIAHGNNDVGPYSRKLTMAGPSSSPTVSWSNLPVMRY